MYFAMQLIHVFKVTCTYSYIVWYLHKLSLEKSLVQVLLQIHIQLWINIYLCLFKIPRLLALETTHVQNVHFHLGPKKPQIYRSGLLLYKDFENYVISQEKTKAWVWFVHQLRNSKLIIELYIYICFIPAYTDYLVRLLLSHFPQWLIISGILIGFSPPRGCFVYR
jgi:hypothetical protein